MHTAEQSRAEPCVCIYSHMACAAQHGDLMKNSDEMSLVVVDGVVVFVSLGCDMRTRRFDVYMGCFIIHKMCVQVEWVWQRVVAGFFLYSGDPR